MRFCCDSRFVTGESLAGPSHIAKNIPNQDSFLFVRKRKYTLLIVSDGLGSKPRSHIGSAAACIAVKEELARFAKKRAQTLPLPTLLKNIVSRWESVIQPHSPKDCSATCLFLFATRRKILVARLGDGMVCLLGKNPEKDVFLGDSKDGTFSNATFSLSDTHSADEFKVDLFDRSSFCGAVLTTDGISADMENGKELLFAKDVFSELDRMKFWKRRVFLRNMLENWPVPHHTDDKTIIVAGL